MTHDELCRMAASFLKRNKFGVVFDDRFRAITGTGECPDALGFRNGCSVLIEVKVSRADYLRDKKKHFRAKPEMGMGDWRFYMAPKGLIRQDELPAGWGLLEVSNGRVYKTCGWPKNTTMISGKPFKAHKQAECDYMYSALRRMEIRGHLDEIYLGIPSL